MDKDTKSSVGRKGRTSSLLEGQAVRVKIGELVNSLIDLVVFNLWLLIAAALSQTY